MENNERDTHFKGFANLLYHELSESEGGHETMISDYRNKYDKQEIVRLIAQRAHDLVYHSLEFTRTSPDPRTMQLSSTEVWMKFIPDLTEWPPKDQPM